MKKLLLLVLFAVCAWSQSATHYYFRESSLSGAATRITIQQPASPSKTIRFTGAYVYCSAECTVTLEHTGGTATTTEATPSQMPDQDRAATVKAFYDSDASGSVTLSKHTISAGDREAIEMQNLKLPRTANKNLSFAVASMTGTVRIYVEWRED